MISFIQEFYNNLVFFFQKLTRGFSDKELWDFDIQLAKYILPRLKKLKENKIGYFDTLPSMDNRLFNDLEGEEYKIYESKLDKEQDEVFNKMLNAFQLITEFYGLDRLDDVELSFEQKIEMHKRYMKEVKEGLQLFVDNYMGLWD